MKTQTISACNGLKPAAITLDLESVLVPEIWITVAKKTGIKELMLTTRDVADYNQLMRGRMKICRQHGLTLAKIRQIVGGMNALPGAMAFLKWAQQHALTIIISDTFHELSGPLVAKLRPPMMVCNWIATDSEGYIDSYTLRQEDGKRHMVLSLKNLGFRIAAVGDSFNDLTMLREADLGMMLKPSAEVSKHLQGLRKVNDFTEIKAVLTKWLKNPASVTVQK